MSGIKEKLLAAFDNMWLVIKKNAEIKGMNPIFFIIFHVLKSLAYTIPGFLVVLLFPIKSDVSYGWFSGIWQGWFGLCNIVIRYFSPETLYIAPNSSLAYDILWWICFVYAILLLLSIIIMPLYHVHSKRDYQFVDTTYKSDDNVLLQTLQYGVETSFEKRVLKIFISSTFQDMQEERDYLMRHTFPELQRLAAQRGVKIIPVDLRWGITEEDSKSGKVLELCLQEIDNAIPFFIGIIGKRYGWCPSHEEFEKSTLLKEKYPWIEKDFKDQLSVTEIEMQYGVLRRKERVNAAFFTTGGNFITSQSDDSEKGKVDRLKKAILEDGRYSLVEVTGGSNMLGNEVYKMYTAFLDQYFPVKNSSNDTSGHETMDTSKPTRSYIEDYLAQYSKKLSDAQTDTILRHPLSENRVVLKSLLDELVLFGKYEELDEHIAYLLQAQTPSQFYQILLQSYEEQYGEESVRNFFSIMLLTGYGLKVRDALLAANVGVKAPDIDPMDMILSPIKFMRDFFYGITNVQYLPFDQYFHTYLERHGDVIRLNHKWMEQAVDERYLTDAGVVSKYREEILDEVDLHADTRNPSPNNLDRIEEVVYQMLELGKVSDLQTYVDSPNDYVVCSYLKKRRPELYKRMLTYLGY
ncbi:DUF4062 domain-containing protein [Prevotella sp. E2-28]|uniref:DUF4062 domain-containing protein n=1 Tax=Prevotella sp. E2-28 TaxID=2913620 RepID=UPI001EDA699A|nr:DUF4062 domain-containing protein [Prevotella sp. E2-28]UKK54622.1 DUF4062 domain-containing protein [Prevotella sp. E2-28]